MNANNFIGLIKLKKLVQKGPSIKDVRTKLPKIDPSPLWPKCPHWLNPPSSFVRADTS